MVLGLLLTITLAISYATLRGQGTTGRIGAQQRSRSMDARVAAQSGLAAVAMRKMSENSWGGIELHAAIEHYG